MARGDPGCDRGLRVRQRLPVVRAVTEMRQRERAPRQGRSTPVARADRRVEGRRHREVISSEERVHHARTPGGGSMSALGLAIMIVAGAVTLDVILENTRNTDASIVGQTITNVDLGGF